MFRVYTGSATDILNEVFPLNPPWNYNLRNQQKITVRRIKPVNYGLNSLAYLGPRIWKLLSNNFKRLGSAEAFKFKKPGYMKTAQFLNHIFIKWVYKFISKGFN